MFVSRAPATIACLVALAGSAAFVQWTAGNQVANGRASLTQAARRYLVKVETEVGGLKGFTEAQVVEAVGRRYLSEDRVVLEWEREEGDEWRVVGPSPRPR